MDTDKPKIPFSVFRKMANSLPPQELAQLPPEQLPERIPVEFLESLSPDASQVIDELIMAQQVALLRSRKSLTEAHGSTIARAVSLSQRSLEGTVAGELRRKLTRLRNRRTAAGQELNVNLAIEMLEMLEADREMINRIMDDHRLVIKSRKQLRTQLFQPSPFSEVLEAADKRLASQSKDLCDLAGYYYSARCELCLIVMRGYQQLQARHLGLKSEISKRVNTLTGFRDTTSEKLTLKDGKQLHNEVRSLFGKMRDHDLGVDESDLTYWLDIVLEFSLFRRKKPRYETLAVKSEAALADFIRDYSEKLEDDHNSLRSNRYAPVPVERGDDFAEESKKFLSVYFERKKEELSQQTCIPAADRFYALNRARAILG